MNDTIIWSVLGIALMALEIFGLQGIGVLFTGFSAITVSFLIYLYPSLDSNISLQLIYFFIFTAVWAGILWIPLKNFFFYGQSGDYSNIIGTYATTHRALKRGEVGKVRWSGTIVRAVIAESSPNDVIGDKVNVKISFVEDGLFHVTENIRTETPQSEPSKDEISQGEA